MDDLYFANKVLLTRDFKRYAFYHDEQLGCHVDKNYFLDNKIYAFRYVDGQFVDDNGIQYQEFASNKPYHDIVWCHDCDFYDVKPFSCDCDKRPSYGPHCVGITNVFAITDLFKNYTTEEALKIINGYNASIENPFVPIFVSDEHYETAKDKSQHKIRKYLKKHQRDKK